MRVAIIGKGYGWWNFKHESFDGIWAINDIYRYIFLMDNAKRKVDRIYDMHDFRWSIEDCERHYRKLRPDLGEAEIKNRARFKHNMFKLKIREINYYEIPLISVRKYNFIPSSIEYPKQFILKDVCHGRDYLHGTLAYALASAISRQIKDIKLFGCILAAEYSYQHPSVAYLIAIADERGLNVDIDRSGGSEILAADFNYGYIESYSP